MLKAEATPADERGSMIIGVGVMMILALLSLGIFARTISTTEDARQTQDYNAALAAADGGLADATFLIDQNPPDATLEGTGTLGGSTYEYRATRVSPNRWTVESTGTVNGVPRSVQVDVHRPVAYPYAIFTRQNLRFNGSGASVRSYNSVTGQMDTGNAIVGSNRAITCNGGGGGDGEDYFAPEGSVSGCANPQQRPGPNVVDDPVAPPASDTQPCPTNGVFSGMINGQAGRTFLCDRDVTFSGTVSLINAPVIIYVTADHEVAMANAIINRGPLTSGEHFQLLKAGSGAFDVGNGSHAASVNGVIYAPSSDIEVNGGKLEMDGSLTLNRLTVNGNPNFEFLYDDSIAEIATGTWRQEHWREVAGSTP